MLDLERAESMSASCRTTCMQLYVTQGQLGNGNVNAVGDDEKPSASAPLSFSGGLTVRAVAAGYYHTCAILSDNSTRCWGSQTTDLITLLGYAGSPASQLSASSAAAVSLGNGVYATQIAAGSDKTCVVLNTGMCTH